MLTKNRIFKPSTSTHVVSLLPLFLFVSLSFRSQTLVFLLHAVRVDEYCYATFLQCVLGPHGGFLIMYTRVCLFVFKLYVCFFCFRSFTRNRLVRGAFRWNKDFLESVTLLIRNLYCVTRKPDLT